MGSLLPALFVCLFASDPTAVFLSIAAPCDFLHAAQPDPPDSVIHGLLTRPPGHAVLRERRKEGTERSETLPWSPCRAIWPFLPLLLVDQQTPLSHWRLTSALGEVPTSRTNIVGGRRFSVNRFPRCISTASPLFSVLRPVGDIPHVAAYDPNL